MKKLDEAEKKDRERKEIIEKRKRREENAKKQNKTAEYTKNLRKNVYNIYDILEKIIDIILNGKDINKIDEYEYNLTNFGDFKIKKFDTLFERYLHIYLFAKNNIEEFLNIGGELNQDDLNILCTYYDINKKEKYLMHELTLAKNNTYYMKFLFTVIFDYSYIYSKNIDTLDPNAFNMIMDENITKEQNKNYIYDPEMEIYVQLSSVLPEFFKGTQKYIIEQITSRKNEQVVKDLINKIYEENMKYYNICSDDFIFHSMNEIKYTKYSSKIIHKVLEDDEYRMDLMKYSNMHIEEKDYIDKIDINVIKFNLKCIFRLRVNIKTQINIGHALLLITEQFDDRYEIFLFCPNGISDIIEYADEITLLRKQLENFLDKKVNFTHSTLIKNQSLFDNILKYKSFYKNGTENGYIENVQSIVYGHKEIYKKIDTDYGTCAIWCVLFMEIYIYLNILYGSSPLTVFRYIIKKYDSSKKLAELIQDYILYFVNKKYTYEEKNEILKKNGIAPCYRMTNSEYFEQYKKYTTQNNNSPVYDDVFYENTIKTYDLLPDDYFLFKYDNTNVDLDITNKKIENYLNLLHDKYNVYIVDNDNGINKIYKNKNNIYLFDKSLGVKDEFDNITYDIFNNIIVQIFEKHMCFYYKNYDKSIVVDVKLDAFYCDATEKYNLYSNIKEKYNIYTVDNKKYMKYFIDNKDVKIKFNEIIYILIDLFIKHIYNNKIKEEDIPDTYSKIVDEVTKNETITLRSFHAYINQLS